ncbi:MAG: heme-binding protein [Planctomycetota bacterium]
MASRSHTARRWLSFAVMGVAGAAMLTVVGCVRTSGETWYFKSASLPEGWPTLTAVDVVEVKAYPTYRAASIDAQSAGGGMNPMFMSLFKHISSNDIAMTAPVDMGYAGADDTTMTSMAFLYRTTNIGATGQDGEILIEDIGPQTFASVGVRGDYTNANFDKGMRRIEDWLAGQSEWQADGSPRYLGYNGPFVPSFWKYGEVQIPVSKGETLADK